MQLLRAWNHNYATTSVAQTVAIYWAERLLAKARARVPAAQPQLDYISFTRFALANTSPAEKVATLAETLDDLTRDFGTWKMPWGDINRYQRLTGRIEETYDDQQPSRPVAFTSSAWGSLAAFGARTYPGTKKRYGNVGNSFVAVVEFGPRITARSVVTGGQSSRPGTPHFTRPGRPILQRPLQRSTLLPRRRAGARRKNLPPRRVSCACCKHHGAYARRTQSDFNHLPSSWTSNISPTTKAKSPACSFPSKNGSGCKSSTTSANKPRPTPAPSCSSRWPRR